MEYQELLKLWGLKAYISTFEDEGITDESFLLLDEATIKSIFKKIGTYGKFNIADPKIMKMTSAPAIGIDLGTSYSLAAVYRKGKSEIIPNRDRDLLTPSFIWYDPDNLNVYVGKSADEKSPQNIDNFLYDMKRLIGRKYDDVYVEELRNSKEYRFNIIKGADDKAEIELLHDKVKVSKTPEQASSEILRYLRESACEFLGVEVTDAVISIPAHFSNAQRKATLAAAELAGIKVLKLITEPVAAAIHYSEDRLKSKAIKATLLVFDFGGGTLDVSIIEVNQKTFRVKSVEGDSFLGGRDIDRILVNHFKTAMKREFDRGSSSQLLLKRFKEYCIRLKMKLSTEETYSLPMYWFEGNEDQDVIFSLSRTELEALTEDLFKRALNLVEVCLHEAGLTKSNIDEVILVGGTTRIPKVRQMLSSYFGASKIHTDINPDEAVALGAAVQATLIKEKRQELEKYNITEVTPLSLGLEVGYNLMSVFIEKNSILPYISKPKSMTTAYNNQTSVSLKIFEGQRKNCKLNNLLGSFKIEGLPRKKARDVKFEVVFSLNEDGILEVTAEEKSTAKSCQLVTTLGKFRLSDHKIRRTIEDAKKNRKEDEEFEKLASYKMKVATKCSHILYDLHNIVSVQSQKFVKRRAEQLVKKLEHIELIDLRKEYKSFRVMIKPFLISDKIDVNISDPE